MIQVSSGPTGMFAGQTVFITGVTGFLGKTVVEKLLRCCPDVHRILMLVRPGKGKSSAERLQSEVIESPIFDALKRELDQASNGLTGQEAFAKLAASKLGVIAGDMTVPLIGISADDLNALHTTVNVVLHCAASVDFNEPLGQAVQLNIVGALELFDMASTWSNVHSFVHVSTAYVAANHKHGHLLPEAVNDLPFDVAQVVADIKQLASGGEIALEHIRLKIMGSFPNTYTLTKAMAEVLIRERKSKMPVAIVRPSIIGSAWREPCPGWIDVVSAAAAVFLAVGLGVITMLPGDPRGIADIIPVDIVVNHMLLAATEISTKKNEILANQQPSQDEEFKHALSRPLLHVSHSSSGTANPVRWRVIAHAVVSSFNLKHTPSVKLTPGPVKFRMIHNRGHFDLAWAMFYQFPSLAYNAVASAGGSEHHKNQAQQLSLLTGRAEHLVSLFKPFTTVEYLFATDTMRRWAQYDNNSNKKKSQPLFSVDLSDVVWPQYFDHFAYGINKFILKEDVVTVKDSAVTHNDLKLTTDRLLHWDSDHHRVSFPGLFPDASWAYTSSRKPGYSKQGVLGRLMGLTGWREGLAHEASYVPRATIRPVQETLSLVLSAPRVQRKIQQEATKTNKSIAEVTARAQTMLAHMSSGLEDRPPRQFGWALRKAFRKLYDGIRVDTEGIERIRRIVAEADVPIVLVPTHRSYVDFLVISFIFFAYNLPVPFIAADEGFANMTGVSGLLRNSGAFFLKRDGSFTSNEMYQVVLTEYVQRLLEDKQTVELFVEGTRSRTGKCLDPRLGFLSMAVDAVLTGRVTDVLLVPIAIDYEKPLEVTLYADEMVGTRKVPESTTNLLKTVSKLNNKFGHVSVQFEQPISVTEYLKQSHLMRSTTTNATRRTTTATTKTTTPTPTTSSSNPPIASAIPVTMKDWTLSDLTRPLGYRVIRSLNATSLCMTTHLVATLVLVHRHGISLDQLVPAVDWLRDEVRQRGSDVVCVEGIERRKLVENALSLLKPLVRERSGYRIVEVAVNSFPKDFTNMIALGYYRNKIIHLFAEEGIWVTALCARNTETGKGISSMNKSISRTTDVTVNTLKKPNNDNGSFGEGKGEGGDVLQLSYRGHGRSELMFAPSSTSTSAGRSPRARPTSASNKNSNAQDIYLDLPPSSHKSSSPIPTDHEVKNGADGCGLDDSVALGALLDDVSFLSELLKREFVGMKVLDPEIKSEFTQRRADVLMDTLDTLTRRGVVSVKKSHEKEEDDKKKSTSNSSSRAAKHGSRVTIARDSQSDRLCSFLCTMIWPFVDSYFVAASALLGIASDANVERSALIQRMSLLAESMFHTQALKHYESCSIGVLRNAILTFSEWGVLATSTRQLPRKLNSKTVEEEVIVKLLPPFTTHQARKELVARIGRFRRPTVGVDVSDLGSAAVAADFPLLANM